jgi:hypothetical protein
MDRSHAKVAAKLGKSVALMNRWSAVWSWERRISAWDTEVNRQALAEAAKQQADMTVRHIQQAKAVQFKAIERLAIMEPAELEAGRGPGVSGAGQ